MTRVTLSRMLKFGHTIVGPFVAIVLLIATWGVYDLHPVVVALVAVVLIGAVLAAVHHAEVVAHRVGEPFGSLILAVAVTVIEVALIITLMISGGPETETLARDTVFAAVMITCNGIVGISLLFGTRGGSTTRFNSEGTGAALGVVATLATLTLVLPNFTTSEPGAQFSAPQLAFAAIASLVLYGVFVVTQTVRHRDFFLPVGKTEEHTEAPTNRQTFISLGLLAISLVAVVGLAKAVSPSIEHGVAALGIPNSFVGVVIALLVLLPEGLAASRAALRERMQTSLNLSYGSAMASIGLTIPAIAVATLWLDGPLTLGLGETQMVLLILTVVVGVLTIIPGRATRLQAILHLIIFAAFIFLAINP